MISSSGSCYVLNEPSKTRVALQLCNASAPLQQSHIVPEFFYRYDKLHRLLNVTGGEDRPLLQQKGTREPLLCSACEQYLNEHFEKPMKRMWVDQQPLPSILNDEAVLIRGLDYASFKLFHLSVLWRAAVAVESPTDAKLGPHESRLREMLLARVPGPAHRYPIVGVILRLPKTNDIADGVVMLPRWGRMSGQTVYRAIFGGCAWHYVISSHRLDPEIQEWALNEAGELRLLVEGFRNLEEIDYLFSNYERNAKLHKWTNPWILRKQNPRKRGGG